MATAKQVAAADTAGRPTGPAPTFVEGRSDHQTGGASAPLPVHQTELAARLMARESPDLAEMLGLTLPAWQSPADAVITAAVRDGADGVRAWADSATRSRITAARRGLAERRAQREGR